MRQFRGFSRALFGAIFALVIGFAPLASAAVYSPRQALPATTIQQFLANPSSLLSQFPNGGPLMITKVRDLAASDPATLSALIGLLKSANPDQASAIGTALGQVALMAVNSDPAFATQIQTRWLRRAILRRWSHSAPWLAATLSFLQRPERPVGRAAAVSRRPPRPQVLEDFLPVTH